VSRNRWFQALLGTAAICLLGAAGAASRLTAGTYPCTVENETFCGDGGPATQARLLRPLAVTARRNGGYFVADTGNQAVRMVLPNGVISTVAGIGVAGFGGDHGPANAAELNHPTDIAPTEDGGLLIADTGNNVIRRVSPNGTITTVAGHPGGSNGQPPSTTPAAATSVDLDAPTGVAAIDSGGFLIADTGSNLVLRVSADGQLRVIAGTGAAGYGGDGGVALDATLNAPTRVLPTANGAILVLDQGNGVVRRLSPGGVISSVPGTETTLSHDLFGQLTINPGGLVQDASGEIFLIDDRQIVEVSPGGDQTVLAGTGECDSSGDGGPAADAAFATPTGIAATADGLLVVDYNNQSAAAGNVRLIRPDGTIETVAGAADTGHCIGAGGAPSGALWPIFYITNPRTAHAFRPVAIKFVSTRASNVRTSLLKNGRRVRTLARTGSAGLNVVTLRGVARGFYTMEIRSTATVPNNNADEGGELTLDKRFRAPLTVRR
jgi:hypothetical protein